MGLDEPRDLATTSLIPTTSQAALIGPPAIMPVPEGADLNNTFPAPSFDKTYEVAQANGAIGGKLSGAGGGGFFTFYCEEKQTQLRAAMEKEGLRELRYDFDFEGTKVLANFWTIVPTNITANNLIEMHYQYQRYWIAPHKKAARG